MANPVTCGVRSVAAPDGQSIPVPVGGLGLPDGSSVEVRESADVRISIKSDGSYFVVLDNSPGSRREVDDLFAELTQEGSIAVLESLAQRAFTTVPTIAIRAAGLLLGVLATLLNPSATVREVFIRCDLDTGMATDGPPITYCLLLPP